MSRCERRVRPGEDGNTGTPAPLLGCPSLGIAQLPEWQDSGSPAPNCGTKEDGGEEGPDHEMPRIFSYILKEGVDFFLLFPALGGAIGQEPDPLHFIACKRRKSCSWESVFAEGWERPAVTA